MRHVEVIIVGTIIYTLIRYALDLQTMSWPRAIALGAISYPCALVLIREILGGQP